MTSGIAAIKELYASEDYEMRAAFFSGLVTPSIFVPRGTNLNLDNSPGVITRYEGDLVGAMIEYSPKPPEGTLANRLAQQRAAFEAQCQAAMAQAQSPFAGGLDGLAGMGQSALQQSQTIDWSKRELVQPKPEEKKMFSFYSSMKEYVKRHGDIIFTVFFIMAADKWFFQGALKGALQRLVEKMISKADLHLDKPVVDAK